MFTGIIQHQAQILAIQDGLFMVQNLFSEPLKIGQSIAHDGACMTLTEVTEDTYSFFAMEETLRVTNFGTKKIGDMMNVEHALHMGDALDGHLVVGHIDTTGTVVNIVRKDDNSLLVTIQHDLQYRSLLVKKGSITLNGVSLTLVDVSNDTFIVSLIPLTQEWTNLGALKKGDILNIEYDMIAKFVAQMVHPYTF